MKRRRVLALSTGALTTLSGCTDTINSLSGSGSTNSQRETIPGSQGTLTLLGKDFTVEGDGEFQILTLTGRVQNISNNTLNQAQIEIRFKDASGAILNTSSDFITDLRPDQVWRFQIFYPGDPPEELNSATIIADTVQY